MFEYYEVYTPWQDSHNHSQNEHSENEVLHNIKIRYFFYEPVRLPPPEVPFF